MRQPVERVHVVQRQVGVEPEQRSLDCRGRAGGGGRRSQHDRKVEARFIGERQIDAGPRIADRRLPHRRHHAHDREDGLQLGSRPGGMTPITVALSPFTPIARPTMPRSPPKRSAQSL
jgi:hypothetical protein